MLNKNLITRALTPIVGAFMLFSFGVGQELPLMSRGLVRDNPSEMRLVVEPLHQREDEIGLTSSRIENRVRLRLREAGIMAVPSSQFLLDGSYVYVNVQVGRFAARVSLEFNRFVKYEAGGQTHSVFAATWSSGGLATFRSLDADAGAYVLGLVEEVLDIFLLDYFEANPETGRSTPAGSRSSPNNGSSSPGLGGVGSAFDPLSLVPQSLLVPASLEASLGDERATVDGREIDLYNLLGPRPGETVQVEMTSAAVDTYLYWLDPEPGIIRASNDDYDGSTSRSALTLTVPDHGRVWIAATSFSGFDSGAYDLSITREDN